MSRDEAELLTRYRDETHEARTKAEEKLEKLARAVALLRARETALAVVLHQVQPELQPA